MLHFTKNVQVADLSLHHYGVVVVVVKWNFILRDAG